LNRKDGSDDLPIRNAAFSAISAIKSLSNYSVRNEDEDVFLDTPSSDDISYWFPLIVFGGKLFEVYYGDNYENVLINDIGELSLNTEVEEVNRAKCTFSTEIPLNPYEPVYSTIGIDVITVKHLSTSIKSIINAVELIEHSELPDKVANDWRTYLNIKGFKY
jgi:hypothetical protein